MRYNVHDSHGCLVRKFSTYPAALNYKTIFGNTGWTIEY